MSTERLVDLHNENLAEELDRLATMLSEADSPNSPEPFCLDIEALGKLSGKPVSHQAAYLLDMARFEALDTMGENRKAVELLDRHV